MVADDLLKLSLFGDLGGFSEDTCLTRHQRVNEVVLEARADVVVLDTPVLGSLVGADVVVEFAGCAECNLVGPDFFPEWEAGEYLLSVFVESVSEHDPPGLVGVSLDFCGFSH